ncbi:MAG: tetratricopeptide repeat protein [Thermodesulfovibrionales bacterium]|jgi:tetratricopeptide (TPR) repeat protein
MDKEKAEVGVNGAEGNGGRIIIVLFLLSVFLLAITKIQDTDTWTHLSFGRWIWEHKSIPLQEPFIDTGKPLSYTNWLFGFVFYAAYHFFGVSGVILLKAIIITLAFAIFLRDALRPYRNSVVAILAMTVVVYLVRHRFIERPDIFLMLFLAYSVFSLNAFLYDRRKYLYALPFVYMLWANSHTSLPLMVVPFFAFLAGGLLQVFLTKKGMPFQKTPTASQLRIVCIIFIASLAASLASPYFVDQYTQGTQVLAHSWWRTHIGELNSPDTWEAKKGIYLMTGAVLTSFLLNYRRLSLIELFLVMPFLALSYSAVRFIWLCGVITGPIIARNIASFLESKAWEGFFSRRLAFAGAGCLVILFLVLTMTKSLHYLREEEIKAFGFGVNYYSIPEDALRFMDKYGISGKIFNNFSWGGYITWRDFPKRKAFVDGRGFQDSALLQDLDLARVSSVVLDELQKQHGFEAVLINYPRIMSGLEGMYPDIDVAFAHPGWALVYWDDLSLLYLRRGGPYESVIERNEYKVVKPANDITAIQVRLVDRTYRENLVKELIRNIGETQSSKAYLFLGCVYNESGLYREAIDADQKALKQPRVNEAEAYKEMAYAQFRLGNTDEAIKDYKLELSIKDDATSLLNLGLVYIDRNDKMKAVKYLEKAVTLDRDLISAYPFLMRLYSDLGMGKELAAASQAYRASVDLRQGEEHFQKALRAYAEKDYHRAIKEFQKSLSVYPENPVVYSDIAYVYYDMDEIDKSYDYQKKAIEIDPDYANAHYGLALVYKKRGDRRSAKQQWEEYLRIEPTGYYAKKATEEVQSIGAPLIHHQKK